MSVVTQDSIRAESTCFRLNRVKLIHTKYKVSSKNGFTAHTMQEWCRYGLEEQVFCQSISYGGPSLKIDPAKTSNKV